MLLSRIAQNGEGCGMSPPTTSDNILLTPGSSKLQPTEESGLSFHEAALQLSVLGAGRMQSAISAWSNHLLASGHSAGTQDPSPEMVFRLCAPPKMNDGKAELRFSD